MKRKIGFFVVAITLLVLLDSCLDTGDDVVFFDAAAQYTTDTTLIEQYLAENNIVAQIDTVGGIRYVLHDPGTGIFPTTEDDVVVDYEGWVLGEQESFDDGDSVTLSLNRVILGWQIGLQYLREGGSATLYIPSAYGYGFSGIPPEIPGNAVLTFDVTLRSVVDE